MKSKQRHGGIFNLIAEWDMLNWARKLLECFITASIEIAFEILEPIGLKIGHLN